MQPMDVAFFGPLKKKWRNIIQDWKQCPTGSKATSIPKDVFPRLLKKLMEDISVTAAANVKSGFRKCGVVPLDSEQVLRSIPAVPEKNPESEQNLSDSFEDFLKKLRREESTPQLRRRTRIKVVPGKSVAETSQESESSDQERSEQEDDPVGRATSQSDMQTSDEETVSVAADVDDSTGITDDESRVEGEMRSCALALGQWILVKYQGERKDTFYVGKIEAILDNGNY